jgi:hypothetical protein
MKPALLLLLGLSGFILGCSTPAKPDARAAHGGLPTFSIASSQTVHIHGNFLARQEWTIKEGLYVPVHSDAIGVFYLHQDGYIFLKNMGIREKNRSGIFIPHDDKAHPHIFHIEHGAGTALILNGVYTPVQFSSEKLFVVSSALPLPELRRNIQFQK